MKNTCILVILVYVLMLPKVCKSQIEKGNSSYFWFDLHLTLPGTKNDIFNKITGNIKPWWDHSFSKNPQQLVLEPKVNGGFYEFFDENGNGVKHATVTGCQNGEFIRFEGPLGLAGLAFNMVVTYKFEEVNIDSAKVTVNVHAVGEIAEGIPEIVYKVWQHFIFERFEPYYLKELEH